MMIASVSASASASAGRGLKLVSFLFLLWVCTMCYILISLNNKISERPIAVASNDSGRTAAAEGKVRSRLTVVQIRRLIRRLNEQQTIYNRNSFGALTDDSVVIVIRVHGRLTYLRDIIYSLSLVKSIENSLLVFSHDRYDEEINAVVRSVDFCKVLQIYYPHSTQTHPNTFPADSPNDCPHETTREEAMKMNCTNALHPDALGRYREAEFAQTKHHWWWQMNRVFDQLSVSRNFTGNFVFLQDDHYVLPDIIHVLRLMEVTRVSHCPQCQILSLGSNLSAVDVDFAAHHSEHVKIVVWQNTGLVLRRSVWLEVKSCAHVFCTHDDFHWEWSLSAASRRCLANELKAVQLLTPRVYRIGECGSHSTRSASCTTGASTLSSLRAMLKVSEEFLFPEELLLVKSSSDDQSDDLLAINGGWGDVRDHKLCLKMVTFDGSS